ncbi:MAG TPA: transposase [Candidatus Paceibacterota bacterium]|nr:transposase [Candidatus Paceibacterota bacterium]
MTNRAPFAPQEFYHLYNRGTDKRKVFVHTEDYERFICLLYLANSKEPIRIDNMQRAHPAKDFTLLGRALTQERGETLVDIVAYCLMPNHFHLLVREKGGDGISRFMQKLTTGYTMYFNKRYERNGALFQGVFKSEHAEEDRYLKYLLSYIHLNPVKLIDKNWREHGIKNRKKTDAYLERYAYSSYPDYLGRGRPEATVLESTALPRYFETPENFRQNITEWLSYKE